MVEQPDFNPEGSGSTPLSGSTLQRYWTRAQKLSFVWKRHFEEVRGPVSIERRQMWAQLIYEVLCLHGDEGMN